MTDSPTSQAMHLARTELKERAERVAELETALRLIADMDWWAQRADDLGLAARIARTALSKANGGATDCKDVADAARWRWIRRNVVRMEDYAFSVGEDVEAYVDAMIAQRLDEGTDL